MTAATQGTEKVREHRLRAMAKRQGLELRKSRRRDPRAMDHGGWTIVDAFTNAVVAGELETPRALYLDDVEAYLRGVPKIEVELCRVARAYLESRGANRDELRPLVREATKLGVPPDAIALVTEVPSDDVTALICEAKESE